MMSFLQKVKTKGTSYLQRENHERVELHMSICISEDDQMHKEYVKVQEVW